MRMRSHPTPGEGRGGTRTRRRPQASMIVAIIALVAATGGTATALPGSNTVDRNDVAKNAIRSKAIKDGQVTGADLRNGAVTSDDIADGTIGGGDVADGAIADADLARGGISGAAIADRTVAGADLAKGAVGGEQIAKGAVGGEHIAAGAITGSHVAATEPFHLVGTPGEPQFYDGGEGDCVWTNGIEGATGLAPTGFAKDTFGRVWLQGVATVKNGPGGDGRCDHTEAGESEDGLVFELPPGYRPAHFDLSGLGQLLLLAPDAGAEFTGTTIPPGGVYSALQGNAALDGLSIRADDGTAGSAKPAEVSVKGLLALAG